MGSILSKRKRVPAEECIHLLFPVDPIKIIPYPLYEAQTQTIFPTYDANFKLSGIQVFPAEQTEGDIRTGNLKGGVAVVPRVYSKVNIERVSA